MLKPIGFWTYSTTDDDHSRGRLSQLRALLASELQQKIGRILKVNIFQDVAAIPPGTEWEKQIRDAINGSFFLIPIVTPALLQSEWCCQEITLFRQREAATLRRTDLIFPLHYLSIEGLDPSRPEDCYDPEVFRFLRSRQWMDFRTLRLKNPESEDVARKIEAMADAICSGLRRAEDVYAEDVRPQKVTAQAHDRARVDEDRRERETDVKAETVQEGSEAEAKRREEETKKDAADAEAKSWLGKGVRRIKSWLDIRSWSYFKIAVTTALFGLIANYFGEFDSLNGLEMGGSHFLAPFRVYYSATVSLLVTRLTASPIQKLAVVFFGTYVIECVATYILHLILPAQTETILFVILIVLVFSASMLLQWLLVTKALSLLSGFRDRNVLVVMAIGCAACSLVEAIIHVTLVGDLGYLLFAVDYGGTALLFTYGIRKQTRQVSPGK